MANRTNVPGNGRGKNIEIDVERYQAYLDDPSLSDEQKTRIIEALWVIITSFVELGYGVHPAQQACGKPAENKDNCGNPRIDAIEYEDHDP